MGEANSFDSSRPPDGAGDAVGRRARKSEPTVATGKGEIADTAVDPAALCRQTELLAGQRLHEGGGTVNLSADDWLERWRASERP
jgi:hypothetical protein